MNIHIAKNKYFNSLLILMLGSAIVHMALLFVWALMFGQWNVLNYISILNLDWFVPGLLAGFGGDVVSWVVAGCLYVAIFKINK
jgi:hypothetical protein